MSRRYYLPSVWSESIGAVVGIKNNGKFESISNDTLGIAKRWTPYHAFISIIKSKTSTTVPNETKICWEDIFVCVPWDCDTNDYNFTFVDTLHTTQFYAVQLTENAKYPYEWVPICDNYDQLKQNTNKCAQCIQVKFQNKQTTTLPLYFDLIYHYHNDDDLDFCKEIRLPSVIQQIPLAHTRLYWQQILDFDKQIINQAFNIPEEITSHLDCLQKKLLLRQSTCDVLNSNNTKYSDTVDEKTKDDDPHVHKSIQSTFKRTDLRELTDEKISSIVVYLSKSFIVDKFCDDQQRESFTRNCICHHSIAMDNEELEEKMQTHAQPSVDSIFFDLIVSCNINIKRTKPKCLERLINGQCNHSQQCQNSHYNDNYSLQILAQRKDHKRVICMCEFILQGLCKSRIYWKHGNSYSNRQYQMFFEYVLFEYCRALYAYNMECAWQDKDMLYLCHYYLSVFIAMISVDDDKDVLNGKSLLQLGITRGMLAESYWRIGKLLAQKSHQFYTDFTSAARIHYELCIAMIERTQLNIPTKVRTLLQCCRSKDSDCGNRSNYNPNWISISDILEYQRHWLSYITLLRALQFAQTDQVVHRDDECDTNIRVTKLLIKMIDVFGCSLDATALSRIYAHFVTIYNDLGDIGSCIIHAENMLSIMTGAFYRSLHSATELNEMINRISSDLFDMIKQIVSSDGYKKIKLKIKIKTKKGTQKFKTTTITKEAIQSGKYLIDNPKLLLFAACDFDTKIFQQVARNFHNTETVIHMIQSRVNNYNFPNSMYFNLNNGKYLFELLKYCCNGNINLCNNQEIKIILHFYYARYYQIISSSHDIPPFEWEKVYYNIYNDHIALIIKHFHSAFLELIRFNNKTKSQTIGTQISISYISFLLGIWDTKNFDSKKKQNIKQFWMNNFTPYNDTFMPWIVDSSIDQTSKDIKQEIFEAILRDPDENDNYMNNIRYEIATTTIQYIDLMYLYTLLQFKMGHYVDAYYMLQNICKSKAFYREFKHQNKELLFLQSIDGDYRDYSFRNDFCLAIDSISTALQATRCSNSKVAVERFHIKNRDRYPMNCVNMQIDSESYWSRFSGFDEHSLSLLFSLFNMNCRGLKEEGFPRITNYMSSNVLRQIRTSLFLFCMRLGSNNDDIKHNYNYDRLYWIQFGMISIGIQSLLWIDCDKFKLSNSDCTDNYDYKKIRKYLYQFVINYIENGLKFPMTLNEPVSNVARLCLILSCFVVNAKEKVRYMFMKHTFEKSIIGMDWHRMSNAIYDTVVKGAQSEYFANASNRIAFFVGFIDVLQTSTLVLEEKSTRDQQTFCSILQKKKNSKLFVKWKNDVLNRKKYCSFCCNGTYNRRKDFHVCKRCKNAYYCNKKCQKMHWSEHKKNCSH